MVERKQLKNLKKKSYPIGFVSSIYRVPTRKSEYLVPGTFFETSQRVALSVMSVSEKQRFDKNKNMDPQLSVLISRMVEELPRALSELNRNGRKSSHWAWWAWPTEKEGYSEPPPRTAVSRSTAKELLRSAPKVWEQVLCKVAELIEANGGSMEQIIPSIDWGRIHYFVKFWEQQPDLPPWLETRVLPILKQANIDEEAGVSDAGLVLSKKTKFQKDEHVGGSKEAAEEISKAKGAKMEQHCEDNESTAKDRRSRDKKK